MKPFLLVLAVFASSYAQGANPCSRSYAQIASYENKPALVELKKFLQTDDQDIPHRLYSEDGKFKLAIGYLSRDQKRFMILALKAIREGSLQEIEAGQVIGPKVLSALNSLAKEAVAAKRPLKIAGEFHFERMQSRMDFGKTFVSNPKSAEHWSAREIEEFNEAREQWKFAECAEFLNPELLCGFSAKVENGEFLVEYTEPKISKPSKKR